MVLLVLEVHAVYTYTHMLQNIFIISDYDLQATMVECCISALGDSGGRGNHAHHWFSDHTLITAFMNIHETTFETVRKIKPCVCMC